MTGPKLQPSRDLATLALIVRRLRDPATGCPWHHQQSFDTIAPYTIEEAYEVAGAIEDKDWPALKDELGDLLFQVVYHSQLAEERGLFALDDVVEAVSAKMIRRRQDIFADARPEPRRPACGKPKRPRNAPPRAMAADWTACPAPCPRSAAPTSFRSGSRPSASIGIPPTASSTR